MNYVQRMIAWVGIRVVGAGMPKTVNRWWYCGEWMRFMGDLNSQKQEARSDYVVYPVEGKFMFSPFQTVLQDQGRDLIDGLIPGFRAGDRIGLYEQVGSAYYGQGTGAHSDWAVWDDGKKIDLKLVKVITIEQFKKVFPPRKKAPIKIDPKDRLPDDNRIVYIWLYDDQEEASRGKYEGEAWYEIYGMASSEVSKGETVLFWAEKEGFEPS